MKKHDEGYALILVLIVLTVLGLMASFMLSFSLQNVQTQQKYINRMQDQYAAAGEIEAIIGQMKSATGCSFTNGNGVNVDSTTGTLQLRIQHRTVQIDCTLRVTGAITGTDGGPYTICNVTAVEYLSYEISTVGR